MDPHHLLANECCTVSAPQLDMQQRHGGGYEPSCGSTAKHGSAAPALCNVPHQGPNMNKKLFTRPNCGTELTINDASQAYKGWRHGKGEYFSKSLLSAQVPLYHQLFGDLLFAFLLVVDEVGKVSAVAVFLDDD